MPRQATNPLWEVAKPPNYGSENATPASLKIDLHYRELHIWERWTWIRYCRLAKFLRLTPEELASIVCVPHSRLARFEQENHLFAYAGAPDRAAALLLTILETQVMGHLTHDVVEKVFPELTPT